MKRRTFMGAIGACTSLPFSGGVIGSTQKPRIVGVYDSPVQLKWINVGHRVLVAKQQAGEIDYSFSENVAASDYLRTLRNAVAVGPDLIIGASFGLPREARKLAAEFPRTGFLMGDAGEPAGSNFSVFDNWNHEGTYLTGMLAGALSKSGKIGMVGGYPIPDVNRVFNSFIAGARSVRPDAQFKVAYTGTWYDPPKEKEFALAQIDAGVDAIFAERAGVVPAAKARKILALGIINDMAKEDAGEGTIVTSALWEMRPSIDHAIALIKSSSFKAENYRPYSEMRAGGTKLAPYYDFDGRIPSDLKAKVRDATDKIVSGAMVVAVDNSEPKSTF